MKYIIFEKFECIGYPVIFPKFINHCDIAQQIGHKPLSAGECSIGDDGKVHCFGYSHTLKLHCNEGDEDLINSAWGI